jgi:hypothetical protein
MNDCLNEDLNEENEGSMIIEEMPLIKPFVPPIEDKLNPPPSPRSCLKKKPSDDKNLPR